MRRRAALGLVVGTVSALAAAGSPGVLASSCDRPLTQVASGTFTTAVEGDWVMVPFAVPDGCTRVEVSLTHDQVPLPGSPVRHTIDLGVYEPRAGGGLWGHDEFRGWGGSGHGLRATLTAEEASTTRGYDPGPVPAGEWAAELGVAAIAGPAEGDPDGVSWTLRVGYSGDPADADAPWARDTSTPPVKDPDPGWYAGDLHVHGPHSNDARVTWDEVLDDSFGRAGLDFVAVSDHNVTRQWSDLAGLDLPDGALVLRSNEVTTYRGHVNAHGGPGWSDYRTSTVWEWDDAAGSVSVPPLRPPTAPGSPGGLFDEIHAAGGWAQVNHPTTFPAKVPGFDSLCRGCSWEYTDGETDWNKVDAIEVQTGPAGTPHHGGAPFETDGALGPNPFTPLALEWFDRLQRAGFDVTAVGSSDSHDADHQELTKAPIGEATTVVFAEELSEAGIRAAVLAGHAYVKFFSAAGPDLRLTAEPLAGGPEVMMGDELAAPAARFTARVRGEGTGPGPLTLHVVRDGVPHRAFSVPAAGPGAWQTFEFVGVAPGDYRLQLQRGTAIEAITNPVNLSLPG